MFGLFETYKQAFNDSIGNSRVWDSSTLWFYLFLIVLTMLVSIYYQKRLYSSLRKSKHEPTKVSVLFILILLAGVMGLRDISVGTDNWQYQEIFDSSTLNDTLDGGVEPGFILINMILRLFVGNSKVAVFLFSVFIVIIIGKTILSYRRNIDVAVALTCYVSLFYLQSFNLMRIYLASSILLSCFHLFKDGKYFKYCVCVALCSMIHYSSIVMLLPMTFMIVYERNKKVALFGSLIMIVTTGVLSTIFADYIQIARYAAYLEGAQEKQSGVGLMVFFDFLPFLFMLFMIFKKKLTGRWVDIAVCLTVTGFFIRLLAYYIPMTGRLYVHFMPLFLIILPYFFAQLRNSRPKYYSLAYMSFILYLTVRLHYYFLEYLSADGIMPYSAMFNRGI